MLEEFERRPVRDPGQHYGCWEQGEEALTRCTPTVPGLAEVLKTRQREDPLTPSFGHNARQTRERRHVGEFVEREQQACPSIVAVVRRVNEFFNEPHDQGGCDRLVTTRCHNVQLMRTGEKGLNIQRRLTSRRPGRVLSLIHI